MTSDLFVGHPFSSRGIKDHQCVTPLMWSKKRRRRRICRFLAQTHTWNLDPLPPSPCGQMEANSLINSCTCHTLRSHRQRLSFCFTVDGHFLFFFLLSPHSFPLWQAGLSLIVSFMTDTKWGLALIQGRPCTGILWFLSTSVADVWWWHIWQKPSKMEGWEGGDCVYVYWDRHSWEWTETKLLHRPIFNFQQPLTAPSSMPSSNSYNPILGQVWLVESKNRAVCSLSTFFTLWSVLQWWHPGGHLPTVIS